MRRIPALPALLLLAGLAGSPALHAQEDFTFRVAVLGGVGGSFDASPDTGFSNDSFEVSGALVTDFGTLVGVSVGRISFDGEEGLSGLSEAELEYYTVVGEYRYRKGFWDSGIYLGLGDYRVQGRNALDEEVDDNVLGIVFGVNGEVRLFRQLYFIGEVGVHYAFFDDDQIFGNGLVGLALHF